MKCVLIVLVLVQIDTSHQQNILPEHKRRHCNALQTQDIMEYAMPEIRRILQADSDKLDKLRRQHKEDSDKLDKLRCQYEVDKAALNGDKGAVFTRWGRRDCPANITTTVYSGTAGGSKYTHTGAAAEYVCMPNDPIWGPHKDLVYGETVGYLYGAKYQEPKDLFGMPNYAVDVPCAVCFGTQYTVSLMIPGRTQCYPGWTEVYHGDLASGYHGHAAASQYVCVDGEPQAVPGGGDRNGNGKLFYGVKAKFGPYKDGKFLSCVVCMK